MKGLAIFLFLIISSVAVGTPYYISPSGKDTNQGTIDSPFFTLNKAWSAAKAGDIIYARGGIYRYNSRQNFTGKSGTASARINIWAYPGEKPVFTKSSTFATPGFPVSLIYINADYVHIKGIEVAYFTQATSAVWYAIAVQGSDNCIFEQINSHHNGNGMGIRDECSNNLVLNSDFHHNNDPLTSYGNADGLSIAYHSSSADNTVRGCRMWNNSDDGLDLWDNNGTVLVESSWAWKNGYKPDGTAAADGCGFKFGKTSTENGSSFKRTIRNTISVYNRTRGYMQNAANVRHNFYNNIAWKNPKGIEFPTNNLAHVFRNNVVFENGQNWEGNFSNSVSDHNSNNPAPVASVSDFLSTDTTGISGKRKTDGTLPDINFMKLAPGSKLIDAGINVGIAFNGKAPDLGAYESVSVASPVATTDIQDSQTDVQTPQPSQPTVGGAISLSPFPVKDHVTISNYTPLNADEYFRITNLKGTLCFELKLEKTTVLSDIPVKLSPGFYVAQIIKGSAVQHQQKLVFVK